MDIDFDNTAGVKAMKAVHPSSVLRRAARRQPWPRWRVAVLEAAALQVAILGRCGAAKSGGQRRRVLDLQHVPRGASEELDR